MTVAPEVVAEATAAPSPADVLPRLTQRVLVADDREERRRLLRNALVAIGFDSVIEAESSAAALELVETDGADAVLLEIQMSGGLELIGSLRAASPGLAIVVCSFRTDAVTKQNALDAGADAYLDKPFFGKDLRRALIGADAS